MTVAMDTGDSARPQWAEKFGSFADDRLDTGAVVRLRRPQQSSNWPFGCRGRGLCAQPIAIEEDNTPTRTIEPLKTMRGPIRLFLCGVFSLLVAGQPGVDWRRDAFPVETGWVLISRWQAQASV